jgi:hypothetical protein
LVHEVIHDNHVERPLFRTTPPPYRQNATCSSTRTRQDKIQKLNARHYSTHSCLDAGPTLGEKENHRRSFFFFFGKNHRRSKGRTFRPAGG